MAVLFRYPTPEEVAALAISRRERLTRVVFVKAPAGLKWRYAHVVERRCRRARHPQT